MPWQVRLRGCAALLAEGNPAEAHAGALDVLRALDVLQAAAASAASGGGASAPAAMAGACAAKLVVQALLAQGRQVEAALQLKDWLASSCRDASAAGQVLGAFAAGCDLALDGAAEQLCGAATAAAQAFPGRHDPAMAVAERLLLHQVSGTHVCW